MSSMTEKGYLVLGDISGYTSYVATTELEHSQEILTELLQLIIENFQNLLTIVKIEGDAVFACAEESTVLHSQNILDLVESTYVKFRNRVQNIVYKTSCKCNACRAIPKLDLKFFIHFGKYVAQNFGGIHDLVGSDVNLIHRLMKNQISELTGWNAYVMLTEKSFTQIGLPAEEYFEYEETIEHLGSVMTFNIDLQKFYKSFQEKNSTRIDEQTADKKISYNFNIPQIETWEILTDPTSRNLATLDGTWTPVIRPKGRLGIGAVNHCAHGEGELTGETILDWQPFEYFTVENTMNLEKETPLDCQMTFELTPSNTNTKTSVVIYVKFRDYSNKDLVEQMYPEFRDYLIRIFESNDR